jgi:hypothetical protein
MTDLSETELKRELLMLDVELRRKQVVWETPRAILLIVATTTAIAAATAGFIGYKIGATPAHIIVELK